MGTTELNNILNIKENLNSDTNLPTKNSYIHEKILRIMANILLTIGIIGSIVLFFTMGLDSLNAFGKISYYFNFNGFLISIFTLIGSIIMWALLHVICNISIKLNK